MERRVRKHRKCVSSFPLKTLRKEKTTGPQERTSSVMGEEESEGGRSMEGKDPV